MKEREVCTLTSKKIIEAQINIYTGLGTYLKYSYMKNSICKIIVFCILAEHMKIFLFCTSWEHIKIYFVFGISTLITKD